MARKRPPRLLQFSYVGRNAYFLTICCEARRPVFSDLNYGEIIVSRFLQLAAEYSFADSGYCLMPDHLHAVVEGLNERSDFTRFVSMFKQRTAYAHRQITGDRLWQEGYYERVIRPDESIVGLVAYMLHNPIRAGLCHAVTEYPLLGSKRYGLSELMDAVQCPPPRSRP